MNADTLGMLSEQWFLRRALIGVGLGYILRIFEHAAWATDKAHGETSAKVLRFCVMIIPQCAIIGLGLGYVLLAVLAYFLRSRTVIEVSSYVVPALAAFLAVDLRELLRRWQQR